MPQSIITFSLALCCWDSNCLRLNAGTTSGDTLLIIRIQPVFSITIRLNMNTLFSLLFGLN